MPLGDRVATVVGVLLIFGTLAVVWVDTAAGRGRDRSVHQGVHDLGVPDRNGTAAAPVRLEGDTTWVLERAAALAVATLDQGDGTVIVIDEPTPTGLTSLFVGLVAEAMSRGGRRPRASLILFDAPMEKNRKRLRRVHDQLSFAYPLLARPMRVESHPAGAPQAAFDAAHTLEDWQHIHFSTLAGNVAHAQREGGWPGIVVLPGPVDAEELAFFDTYLDTARVPYALLRLRHSPGLGDAIHEERLVARVEPASDGYDLTVRIHPAPASHAP